MIASLVFLRIVWTWVIGWVDFGVVKNHSIRYWDGYRFARLYLPPTRKVSVVTEFNVTEEGSTEDYAGTLAELIRNSNLGVPLTVRQALVALSVGPDVGPVVVTVLRNHQLVTFTSESPYLETL